MDKSLYLLSIRANTHPSQEELAVGELVAGKKTPHDGGMDGRTPKHYWLANGNQLVGKMWP